MLALERPITEPARHSEGANSVANYGAQAFRELCNFEFEGREELLRDESVIINNMDDSQHRKSQNTSTNKSDSRHALRSNLETETD